MPAAETRRESHEAPPHGNRVDAVVQAVNGHIRAHGLMPGDLLPSEGVFAGTLGVSRVVVREAFRSLSALGLIDVGNGRRARVARVDSAVLSIVFEHAVRTDHVSIQQIYDMRRTIESRTVVLAALRRDDGEAAAIKALAAAMRRDFARPEQVMEHDIAFHQAIATASRNPGFSLLLEAFQGVTRQTWPTGWRSRSADAERMESIAAHEAIAAAVEGRDARAAEAAMRLHFDHSVKALVAAGVQ
ncbi:FadR/GntR family transcriptional regulator [Labrys monachus]|uniref:DNA-binding FadR family transcriptional regulator n=1 Tax=Labrys monachus TaxID=217067 RepID=A0ABU0FCQ8_9HYPH|nr:FCD domain-containing protein [Labrys monachus]MDQ0392392.1 DNA-binding FadR family transcriptional regulator [Labrys monachus]